MAVTTTDARMTLDHATSERDFQAMVVRAAEYFGWLVYHTYDSRRSQSGYPDLTMVHPDKRRILFAELKSEKGRVKPAQRDWLAKLACCPVEVYTWRPSNWGEIIATLSA